MYARAIELLKEALACKNNDKDERGVCCQCREAIQEFLKLKTKVLPPKHHLIPYYKEYTEAFQDGAMTMYNEIVKYLSKK